MHALDFMVTPTNKYGLSTNDQFQRLQRSQKQNGLFEGVLEFALRIPGKQANIRAEIHYRIEAILFINCVASEQLYTIVVVEVVRWTDSHSKDLQKMVLGVFHS